MKRTILPKGKPTIEVLMDNYLNLYLPQTKKTKAHGLATAKSGAKPIIQFFGDMVFDDIVVRDIIEYIKFRSDLGRKDGTIRRELGQLSSAINQGVEFGLIDEFDDDGNYSKDYWNVQKIKTIITKRRPPKTKRTERPTYEKVFNIMKHCENDNQSRNYKKIDYVAMRRLIWVAMRLGYRKSELLSLTFNDLDIKERELELDRSKNNFGRITPLYHEVFEFFKHLDKEARKLYGKDYKSYPIFPITKQQTDRPWNNACVKAGFVKDNGKHKYIFHDLRKVAVRYLKEKLGFDDDMICDHYTGHRDRATYEQVYNIRNTRGDSYTHAKKRALSV